MARPEALTLTLLSDTTLGQGRGTPGEVDVEIEHDRRGLPVVRGKVIHGLLRDAWLSMSRCFPELEGAAFRLLGAEADLDESCILRIGDGVVPRAVQDWVDWAQGRAYNPLTPQDILHALTAIRQQTALDRQTGALEPTTLRASRVALRGLAFSAPLLWLQAPGADDVRCLAMLALATRHMGLGRNRGRGLVCLSLDGDPANTRRLAQVEA